MSIKKKKKCLDNRGPWPMSIKKKKKKKKKKKCLDNRGPWPMSIKKKKKKKKKKKMFGQSWTVAHEYQVKK